MLYLPNEIWLLIASYCEPKDVWLSLRPVSRQIQICSEQHFKQAVLPFAILSLPITLPTYDIRNPIRGKAVFHPLASKSCPPSGSGRSDRIVYRLAETEPTYYRSHFFARWDTLQKNHHGSLDERLRWELRLAGSSSGVRLREPLAVTQDYEVGGLQVSFEWKSTMTTFFRAR